MKPAVKVLKNAKKILRTMGWTQGTFARDSLGHVISASATNAVTFCALGAIGRARRALYPIGPGVDSWDTHPATYLGLAVHEKHGDVGVPQWNDEIVKNVSQVLPVFDRAIELAEERE